MRPTIKPLCPSIPAVLTALGLAWLTVLGHAQEVEVPAGGEGAIPAGPNEPTFEGGADGDIAAPPPMNGDGAFAGDPNPAEDAGGNLDQLRIDLSGAGFEVPLAAFEIFPQGVRVEIQSLVNELLPLLAQGREQELSQFFDDKGDRIATVFDQLGLEPNADDLLDVPLAGDSIKFPNEFENYAAYLDTLKLEPFERDYMLQSREIAVQYEGRIESALQDQAKIQTALEDYQQRLEALNERYAEQFREQYLDSIERAGLDGRRPDIDR